jgi:MOSC domain-containing protein YiiM
VGADDEIALISREPKAVPATEIIRLYVAKRFAPEDLDSLRRAMKVAALPDCWKEYLQERAEKAGV